MSIFYSLWKKFEGTRTKPCCQWIELEWNWRSSKVRSVQCLFLERWFDSPQQNVSLILLNKNAINDRNSSLKDFILYCLLRWKLLVYRACCILVSLDPVRIEKGQYRLIQRPVKVIVDIWIEYLFSLLDPSSRMKQELIELLKCDLKWNALIS